MKVTFLGTGASEGVPAMFCSCEFCTQFRKKYPGVYRARTQVLIDGDLFVDFPPEAYANSMRFNVDLSSIKYLLVTHTHMDHFYAHDFVLRGYKYAVLKEDVLHIYGNAEAEKVYGECTAREMKPEVKEHLAFHTVGAFDELRLSDYRILTLPALHGTKEEALLYYIEKQGRGYLHLYDTSAISGEAVKFLTSHGARAALVALDCTFLDAEHREGARHMCLADCVKVIGALKASGVADENTKFVITHFSHHARPTPERLASFEERYSVVAANDGMTFEI